MTLMWLFLKDWSFHDDEPITLIWNAQVKKDQFTQSVKLEKKKPHIASPDDKRF